MEIIWAGQSRKPIPKRFLYQWVQDVKKQLSRKKLWPKNKTELILVFVGTKEMQRLNKQYRKKNKPTDVLSFAGVEPSSLGELILCPSILENQAKQVGHSYRMEVAYMVLHGILHLLGYDHETSDKAASEMYGLQDSIFAQLGGKSGVRRN